MDNATKTVSVEISGPLLQALTCFSQGTQPGVRLDHLDDSDIADPEKEIGLSRTFNLVQLSQASQTSSDNGQAHFTLQSQLNKAYLGFNISDRRLVMRSVPNPPPDSFRFAFSSTLPSHYYNDGSPAHIMAADGKPVNDPNNAHREVSLFVRSFPEPTPSGTIDESWKQQLALISVLGEKDPDEEQAASIEASINGGGGSDLDNQTELDMVADMQKDGSLIVAINALAQQKYDDAPNKSVSPDTVIKLAQLLCIMDKCVYMRDLEHEEDVHSKMQPYAAEIKEAARTSQPIRQTTIDAMMRAQEKGDRATQKIQEVATKMGLNYRPLCNFSSDGSLLRNGPYCGAFYGHSQDKKPFIVIAFKEKMLRNQLWKLERTVLAKTFPFGLRVQAWVTGHSLGAAYATNCWAGMLADMHFMHTTVRGLLTFGSPRVGDKTYATLAGSLKGFRKSWRFVNGNDLVTALPTHSVPMFEPYYHVDSQVNISSARIALGPSELGVAEREISEHATGEVDSAGADLGGTSPAEYTAGPVVFGGYITDHNRKYEESSADEAYTITGDMERDGRVTEVIEQPLLSYTYIVFRGLGREQKLKFRT
ncbi:hypothetical protein VP1G_01738 [Cytospora mali]|uniref:Fungal lipase-type domain-containing protein n=1 Tax=Cytospora mali TaxID=578113 RepID=A0A194URV4_CYTMA|nr:hypothetical protein VP1G_01738 [Valsa mali var. pyri (nom. inval.)]